MAKEQSLSGTTDTVLGPSQTFTGNKTPLDGVSLCSQQSLGLSRSQKKRKRKKEKRRAKAKEDIMVDIHPSEVTSLENHPSIKDSESAPPEIDRNTSTEGGVSLEICLRPRKNGKKKQKKGGSPLRSDDLDSRCAKDTSLNVIPVKLDSDLHHLRTTCLTNNSEVTVHTAEPTSAHSMGSENQQMCHIASTMNAANQNFQEVGFAGHRVASIGVLEKSDQHSGREVLEELDNSKKYLDACSVGKHQEGSGSNVSSFNLSNIKAYQRGRSAQSTSIATAFAKEDTMSSIPVLQDSLMGDTSVSECRTQVTYYRRRKNMSSGSHLSSLESLKESASPVKKLMQNSSAGDTPMDHLDKAVASAPIEEITGEVVATHDMALLVAGDSVMRKAFGECADDYPVSKEEEKKIKIENSGGIVLQHSVKVDDSSGDLAEKISTLDNNNKVEKSSVLDSSNKVEVIENNAKQESLLEPATFDHEGNALDGPSRTHLSIGHIKSESMGVPSSLENAVASSSQLGTTEDNSSLALNTMGSRQQALNSSARARKLEKKLLVLDVNGILADIVLYGSERVRPDLVVSGKAVFKRPFCDEFLKFCFERFHVGVWSSRTKRNVEAVVNFLMKNSKDNLLFCWDQSHCTETGFSTVENREKPLVLKELKNLWEKKRRGLPWKRGEYNESNTLLLDDSPYKALLNPPYTAIFPHPYKYLDKKDNCLGPEGDLRIYLEGLAAADNVQNYVKSNPFGQRAITENNTSWRFYLKVISSNTSKEEEDGLACVVSKESSATETLLVTNSAPRDNGLEN